LTEIIDPASFYSFFSAEFLPRLIRLLAPPLFFRFFGGNLTEIIGPATFYFYFFSEVLTEIIGPATIYSIFSAEF